MSTPQVTKAKTAFAEESGRIAALIERNILTGAPSYPLKRIPETKYDTSMGHSPRTIRWQTVPPQRSEYQAMIASGNEAKNFESPLDGSTISGYGDKQGPGELQADVIRWGYEEFGRCLRGTALETEPMDIVDLLEKKAFGACIQKLRDDLPRYAKEHFAEELLNQVIKNSKSKYSVAENFPVSTGVAYFPCVPTGGPDIGTLRLIENRLRHEGWDEGAETPVFNGRPCLQVYMGRDAIEFAIVQRKKQRELKLESTLTLDDKTFGKTEVSEGIQFLENPLPPRGYIRQKTSTTFEFVRINPWTVTAGAEGIIKNVNPDYYKSVITVGGVAYVVVEIGFIIHPKAMERQAMGAIPKVDGKTFSRMFNFEVNLIPDWAIQADPRLNKDGRYIAYRMTHAYAPLPYNPELMTAFVYIAPTPQQFIVNPNAPVGTAASQPTTVQPFNAPLPLVVPVNASAALRDPTANDCTDLFPANGAGTIRLAQVAYAPDETAGTVTIYVERYGGSTGAATVDYATANGTASTGTEYTSTSGTITWADGVFGIKSFTIPVLNTGGDDTGKTFTLTISNVTTAALGTPTVATITLADADQA